MTFTIYYKLWKRNKSRCIETKAWHTNVDIVAGGSTQCRVRGTGPRQSPVWFTSFQFGWHLWYLRGWFCWSVCVFCCFAPGRWKTRTGDAMQLRCAINCCAVLVLHMTPGVSLKWHGMTPRDEFFGGATIRPGSPSSDGNEVIRWELPLPLAVGIAVTWPSMGSQVSAYLGSTGTRKLENVEDVRSATQKLWWTCFPC